MIAVPLVSVVMGVYNGAPSIRDTVRSLLAQVGVDLEFIIVDDGSTDETSALLSEFVKGDSRVRVIRQDNSGLTRALIRGCAAARGRFIGRQDCGDISLPGRLAEEVRMMESRPDAALVSCGTRVVGPEGEALYDIENIEGDATERLLTSDLARLRGPAHHGGTLFRRELYERVGGYRKQFYFAQDLDLWMRLVEHGRHIAIPDLLYQAAFAFGSISSLHRSRQIACARIILECARLRRAGQSDASAIARATAIVPNHQKTSALDLAAASYFVGVCLRKRGDPRSRRYFLEALRAYPLHVKSAVRLLLG